jgi:putative intracellular protease/amidase
MNTTLQVLMVTTSHDELGQTGHKTGVWLEEFAGPYFAFRDAGATVTVASPLGGRVPLDPKSALPEWQTEATRRFEADGEAVASLTNARPLASIDPGAFDVLFFPGGHGPMWDLPNNPDVARLLNAFTDKPTGLVCHGVAALVGVKTDKNQPYAAGRRLTAFANTEEAAVQLTDVVPFLLEDQLVAEGGIYRKGPDFGPYTVDDDLLVTGQNPASSVPVAIELLKLATVPA